MQNDKSEQKNSTSSQKKRWSRGEDLILLIALLVTVLTWPIALIFLASGFGLGMLVLYPGTFIAFGVLDLDFFGLFWEVSS